MSAPGSITINWDNVSTLTERRMLPKMADQIFRSNALLLKTYDKGTKLDGGAFITQQLLYGEGPGGPYEGVEPLDTSESEILTTGVFNWKFYYTSATIRRSDELKNSGRAAFARLLTAKVQVMQKSMKNHLGTGLHGSSASNPKAINGLQDVTATTGVYGGISTTNNAWWQPKSTAMTGPLTIGAMRTMMGSLTEDNDTPDLLVCPQTQYDIYYNLLQPQQRFASEQMARGGFDNVLFEGRPLVVDSHCAANTIYFLNTDYIDLVTHQDENLRFEGWVKPYNQTARTAFVFWAGNVVCSNRRFQGKLTSVTS